MRESLLYTQSNTFARSKISLDSLLDSFARDLIFGNSINIEKARSIELRSCRAAFGLSVFKYIYVLLISVLAASDSRIIFTGLALVQPMKWLVDQTNY